MAEKAKRQKPPHWKEYYREWKERKRTEEGKKFIESERKYHQDYYREKRQKKFIVFFKETGESRFFNEKKELGEIIEEKGGKAGSIKIYDMEVGMERDYPLKKGTKESFKVIRVR